MSSRLSDYDYELPRELIAQRPLPRREDSRMMVLHRETQTIEHRRFVELGDFLREGDLLVLNNTRVVAARRFSDDGAIEFLFLEKLAPARWRTLVKPGRKMRVGATCRIGGIEGLVAQVFEDGSRALEFASDISPHDAGVMPLPPYMRRAVEEEDRERYQTVFADVPGAVAAPTAGLHFTSEMLQKLPHTFVTLHVGPGTFLPVKSENVAEHQMHSERFSISEEAAQKINAAQRVIAVGTTSLRTLESAADDRVEARTGETKMFIYPPYEFQAVDALLTNFHLPRSTLLMLVSAFAGREFVLRAYAEAIRERYRFYSYGDCMLIL
ncbi:MAG: tRNA preQ1(34) S-adenosylmethionine ribosyltransferase-isomerase QueA [Verrucomicrobiota bacterium]|nr:tRNA preQ1(34) S-adenosylmethionine ribosyltransferase-isomerase QueA [Verrucomicrobiota bacterium]MDQ6939096.1 tRNA preQ1(34) S-adenosylmethionine ribosyltransferase-isomerase QueA [Verrucomicrobiota bacterium]